MSDRQLGDWHRLILEMANQNRNIRRVYRKKIKNLRKKAVFKNLKLKKLKIY